MGRRASGLYVPDPEPIVVPDMSFGIRTNCRAVLRRAKSGTELARWDFHNKLAKVYLDSIFTNTAGFPGVGVESDSSNYFAAGTGTTIPADTDTALVSEIASGGRGATTVTVAQYNSALPDNCQIQRHTLFSTAQANGTIGEFGWFSASTAGSLRARAVPKDTSGTQTTISKTSATTLDLYWNIYIYYIQSDFVVTRTISGNSYTVTARAIGANATTPAAFFIISRGPTWAGSLGARSQGGLLSRTSSAPASQPSVSASSVDAYTSGSYQRSLTFAMTSGMSAFAFLTNCGGNSADQYACIQMGFSPNIVGSSSLKVKLSLTPT